MPRRKSGAHYIFANPLFLKPCSASVFLPFLEKEFPHLAGTIASGMRDRAFVGKAYRQRLSELMAALRKKHGIRKEVTIGCDLEETGRKMYSWRCLG